MSSSAMRMIFGEDCATAGPLGAANAMRENETSDETITDVAPNLLHIGDALR